MLADGLALISRILITFTILVFMVVLFFDCKFFGQSWITLGKYLDKLHILVFRRPEAPQPETQQPSAVDDQREARYGRSNHDETQVPELGPVSSIQEDDGYECCGMVHYDTSNGDENQVPGPGRARMVENDRYECLDSDRLEANNGEEQFYLQPLY